MSPHGLYFFATNREMEHLGRRVREVPKGDDPRELRIRLQKGGYYFVNMASYMAFYFGEVDTTTMPTDAIVLKSQTEVFDQFLSNPKIGRVVVCVHGFNVHLYASHNWYRVLTDTMRRIRGCEQAFVTSPYDPLLTDKDVKDGSLSAFIGFSWPSNGNVFSYNRDQLDAAASAQPLAGVISRIHLHGKSVDLICHSMGNYLACSMLQGLVNKTFVPACFTAEYLEERDRERAKEKLDHKVRQPAEYLAQVRELMTLIDRGDKNPDESVKVRPGYFIDTYIMIAPDVERRHVTKASGHSAESDYIGPFYSGLQHLVGRVLNIYSRFDSALNVSNIEKKPKAAVLSLVEGLNTLTFGVLDFLERNPDYKWEARLGIGPHPSSAPPNFESFNATELAGRAIDHGDHIDSAPVVTKIAESLGLIRMAR
jgi:hypothetical protein